MRRLWWKMINETIFDGTCQDGFKYIIIECSGQSSPFMSTLGNDGSSDAIQIVFGAVIVFIGIIQLLQ